MSPSSNTSEVFVPIIFSLVVLEAIENWQWIETDPARQHAEHGGKQCTAPQQPEGIPDCQAAARKNDSSHNQLPEKLVLFQRVQQIPLEHVELVQQSSGDRQGCKREVSDCE